MTCIEYSSQTCGRILKDYIMYKICTSMLYMTIVRVEDNVAAYRSIYICKTSSDSLDECIALTL